MPQLYRTFLYDSIANQSRRAIALARLEVLSGLSGHGDFAEIEQWLAQSDLAPETPINLIHGDPEALEALRDHLRQNTRFEVDVAGYQSILRL